MSSAHESRRPAPAPRVERALADGRRRVGDPGPGRVGTPAVLALQRSAGNAAVSALMAAKLKSPEGQAATDIDVALKEVRRDEPAIDDVEKGLKAAQAAGVPVELEGPKPPASALAVTKTGFGPASMPAKKPVPPPKPVPAVSPLGKAGAAKPKVGGAGKGAVAGVAHLAGAAGGLAAAAPPAPLSADKLLQPPVPPTSVRPEEDPAFLHVTGNVKGFARAKKAHPPAAAKAKEAQDAALAPSDDVAGQAKAAKVDTMDAQPAGSFDKKAFIAAVKTAIEAKSPKTLEEADEYKESGKAGEVKGDVKGLVTQGKDGQSADIEAATEAPPDQSKAVAKPVTPMAPEQPGAAVPIPAAGAVPKPAPAEQTNLEAGKQQANQEMADANVSEAQLAKSNEPEFHGALADKQAAAAHADSAPAQFRQEEKAVIAQGKAQAVAQTAAGVAGMQGAKTGALGKLVADKGKAKSKDEARRAEVTTRIQGIFSATEAEVKKILDGIDPQVETAFNEGEARARSAFEGYVAAKMSAYKKDRYGGWLGGFRWAKDKLFGMPDKVNEFYEAGRELYLKQMEGVISGVADIVGRDLDASKRRIAQGRSEIATYVKSLPTDLQKVGSEAATEIGDRFNQLEEDVKSKESSVVDTLATKYSEARKGLDERIEALQAENKGLVDKAIGAIKAVINTIRELAAMLKNVLSRAASAVGDIIGDPVGFLGNLISGIKGGINKFFANIGTHLKKGLMGWLFGQLGDAGIEIPDTFDLKGVVKLLASIFGFTWANIRNRIVKQVGPAAMDAMEKGVEIFQVIKGQGLGGLWQMLIEKLGNIKDMILEQIQEFVESKIITAGITWLISLLNPAAAFIKACKLIYDVVMFFVNNASRIMKFVNTVIDGIVDIAKGNVSAVVDKIEDVLGQMVPILIGFIASVLGIGGIGEKIRSVINALRRPFNKAFDFVIKTGLKLAGPIIRGIKGISGKVKAKVAAGKAYVKGKVEAGKKYVRGKVEAGKKYVRGKVEAGKKYVAGKVQAGKETLLRMLRKPFSADGKQHTLTVNQAGKILIASDNGLTMDQHHDGARQAAQASGRTDVYPSIEELNALRLRHEEHFAVVRDQEVGTLDPDNPKNRPFFAAISTITTMAREIWTVIHYSGTPGEAHVVTPEGLGNIAPHSRQRKPRPNLESEHVLPRKWLSNVFEHVAGLKPLSDRQYEQMTTILIHKGAADIKTEGGQGDNTSVRNILTGVDTVANAGPAVITRVDETMKAINTDHQNHQRPGTPMPTKAAVSEAAAIQFGEVVRFVRENSDAVGGRGTDHEGSAALVSEARELISAGDSQPATQLSNLIGRVSRWLTDHSATAPVKTRAQLAALHARLVEEGERRSSH